jgi:hypothetical protein
LLRRAFSLPLALVIVDDYEQLNWFARAWMRWRCRRLRAGLLATSHTPTGLPLLVRIDPEIDVIQQVVAELTECRPTCVTSADIIASHACHGSNVREIFFDLYDRYERIRRTR